MFSNNPSPSAVSGSLYRPDPGLGRTPRSFKKPKLNVAPGSRVRDSAAESGLKLLSDGAALAQKLREPIRDAKRALQAAAELQSVPGGASRACEEVLETVKAANASMASSVQRIGNILRPALTRLYAAGDSKGFRRVIDEMDPAYRGAAIRAMAVQGIDEFQFVHTALLTREQHLASVLSVATLHAAVSRSREHGEWFNFLEGDLQVPKPVLAGVIELLHAEDPKYFQGMGFCLQWASDAMKADLAICRDAVSSDGDALQYVPAGLVLNEGANGLCALAISKAQDLHELATIKEVIRNAGHRQLLPAIMEKRRELVAAASNSAGK